MKFCLHSNFQFDKFYFIEKSNIVFKSPLAAILGYIETKVDLPLIVCWKPGTLKSPEIKSGETKVSIIHKLDYKDCEIWFIRFSMDAKQKVLALGNQVGKTYLWDMDTDDPAQCRYTVLSHPKCTSAIRQTSLSRDGDVLICACDDGTIWRWDRQHSQ